VHVLLLAFKYWGFSRNIFMLRFCIFLQEHDGDWWRTLSHLYVFLFDSGSDNEGIYCLQHDDPESVPQVSHSFALSHAFY